VAETHTRAELDQPGLRGTGRSSSTDPKPGGGAPKEGAIAHRLECCRQEKSTRLGRQWFQAPRETLLDPAGER
jgi:hypothetical protein